MFGFGWNSSKVKPQLKMAVHRFQIAANKKTALLTQQKREVAVLLAEEPPKEEKARIRAEGIIREDDTVEAYEILQLECELLAERIKLLDCSKECPPDLVSVVSTLIWASQRVDIQELQTIRKQLRSKYGKEFEERALNNDGGVLNKRVVDKLSINPPAAYLVQVYLERICEQYEVEWKPAKRLTAEEMANPTAPPVGYSVQVAPASGFGEVDVGQVVSTDDVSSSQYGKGGSNGGGGGGAAIPAVATPYVPAPPARPAAADDFGEVDIFVPAIPAKDDVSKLGDNDDPSLPPSAPMGKPGTRPPPGGGGGSSGTSYADLAARFNSLKK